MVYSMCGFSFQWLHTFIIIIKILRWVHVVLLKNQILYTKTRLNSSTLMQVKSSWKDGKMEEFWEIGSYIHVVKFIVRIIVTYAVITCYKSSANIRYTYQQKHWVFSSLSEFMRLCSRQCIYRIRSACI